MQQVAPPSVNQAHAIGELMQGPLAGLMFDMASEVEIVQTPRTCPFRLWCGQGVACIRTRTNYIDRRCPSSCTPHVSFTLTKSQLDVIFREKEKLFTASTGTPPKTTLREHVTRCCSESHLHIIILYGVRGAAMQPLNSLLNCPRQHLRIQPLSKLDTRLIHYSRHYLRQPYRKWK